MHWRRHMPSKGIALLAAAFLFAGGEKSGAVSPEAAARAPGKQPEVAAVGADTFFVQLASLRTEERAHAELTQLRDDYWRDLKDHNFIVQRADLGSKGVFYRVLVGPYLSRFVASAYCSEIRSSGGDCMVLRRKNGAGP